MAIHLSDSEKRIREGQLLHKKKKQKWIRLKFEHGSPMPQTDPLSITAPYTCNVGLGDTFLMSAKQGSCVFVNLSYNI